MTSDAPVTRFTIASEQRAITALHREENPPNPLLSQVVKSIVCQILTLCHSPQHLIATTVHPRVTVRDTTCSEQLLQSPGALQRALLPH